MQHGPLAHSDYLGQKNGFKRESRDTPGGGKDQGGSQRGTKKRCHGQGQGEEENISASLEQVRQGTAMYRAGCLSGLATCIHLLVAGNPRPGTRKESRQASRVTKGPQSLASHQSWAWIQSKFVKQEI